MKKLDNKKKIALIAVVSIVIIVVAAVIFLLLNKDNTGWQTEGNEKYYIISKEQGRAKNFYEIDGKTYYFGTDGTLVTGWIEIDGKKYYALSDGCIVSGLNVIDNNSYVFRFDDNSLVYGWSIVYDGRYYSDEAGIVKKGFIDINSNKYYFDDTGKLITGTFTADGNSYYADENGILRSGFFEIDGTPHCFSTEDFTALSGWYETEDAVYYFGTDGVAVTGFQTIDEKTYLFSNGLYQTGWQTYNGNEYYFYNDGTMATNTEIGLYVIGAEGIAIKDECTLDNLNEYLDYYLDRYGRTPQNIYDIVHDTMSYKYEDMGASYEEMACYAINNGKGACYQYAAFGYMLFKRAGYEVYVVEGINGRTGNNHMWLYVLMDDGWFYVDPVYNAGAKMTEEYLINNGSSWDKSSLPTN